MGGFAVVGPGHILVYTASSFPVVKEHSNDLHGYGLFDVYRMLTAHLSNIDTTCSMLWNP